MQSFVGIRVRHVFFQHGVSICSLRLHLSPRIRQFSTSVPMSFSFSPKQAQFYRKEHLLSYHHCKSSLILSDHWRLRYFSNVSSPQPTPPNDETKDKENDTVDKSVLPTTVSNTSNNLQKREPPEPKKSIWITIKEGAVHYYHGFRLLLLDVRVAIRLGFRVLRGYSLNRRERKQLVRTVADMLRLIPFLVFIIVPFMEFLLPFYLKFFPFMLPSTFKEKKKEEEKTRQMLKGKLEIAKFIQDTLSESIGTKRVADAPSVSQFTDFMKQVREAGQLASTQDILKFSRLFEDEVTLDSLDYLTLKGLCQLLELPVMGPIQLLRFQIRVRMNQLLVDDKMILMEGVDKLPIWDLQTVCRERGMRAIGLSEQRLRYQLSQWLELHLDKKVPLVLLLITRTMYLPDTFTAEEQIKEAILRLPQTVSNEATVKAAKSSTTESIDNKTMYDIRREEEAKLREEAKVAKLEEDKGKKAAAKTSPTGDAEAKDKAPTLLDTAASLEPSGKAATVENAEKPISVPDPSWNNIASSELDTEISTNDIAQIEKAIDCLEETSTALDEEELDDLKENMAEMESMQSQLQNVSSPTGKNKAAAKLEKKMKSLIQEMDGMIGNLHDERNVLLTEIEAKESNVDSQAQMTEAKREAFIQSIADKKERVVDINDLMLSLRRLQKVPDETKWQQILEVLDEDADGKIEMSHVMEVVELLGKENAKLSAKEIKRVLRSIDRQAVIDDLEKKTLTTAEGDKNTTGPNSTSNNASHKT